MIKEYVQHQPTCSHCGHVVKGIFPDHVTGIVCFGENIQTLVAYLSTLQHEQLQLFCPFSRV